MCLIGVICADLVLNGRKKVMFNHGLNAYVTFGLKYIIYGGSRGSNKGSRLHIWAGISIQCVEI